MEGMRILLLCLVACSSLWGQVYVAKDYSKLIGMPGFSNTIFEMHFKLYEGYVKNTNELLDRMKTMSQNGQELTRLRRAKKAFWMGVRWDEVA